MGNSLSLSCVSWVAVMCFQRPNPLLKHRSPFVTQGLLWNEGFSSKGTSGLEHNQFPVDQGTLPVCPPLPPHVWVDCERVVTTAIAQAF